MSRGGRKHRKKREERCPIPPGPNGSYNQAINFNTLDYNFYLNWLIDLCMNRFHYEGLPDTVDIHYFERQLLLSGRATIATRADLPEPVWVSVKAVEAGEYNIYGRPVKWWAQGWGGERFEVTPANGVFVWENISFTSPWNGLQRIARKLAEYSRTEDINLFHQRMPWILETDSKTKASAEQMLRQIAEGQAAVLARKGFSEQIPLTKYDLNAPFIGEALQIAMNNTFNLAYRFIGIDHLAFQKGERMISEEAQGNAAPTRIKLMNSLSARRYGFDEFNRLSGYNVTVVANEDVDSYNWAMTNNLLRQAELKVLNPQNFPAYDMPLLPEQNAEGGNNE